MIYFHLHMKLKDQAHDPFLSTTYEVGLKSSQSSLCETQEKRPLGGNQTEAGVTATL